MDKHRMKQLGWALVITALHVLAVICRELNIVSVYGTLYGSFFGLLRSMIYLVLFTAWGVSLRHRITAVYTRRYVSAVAQLIIFWILIRTVKYTFAPDPNVNRWLWYLYYVPMLLLPLMSLYTALSLGKYGSFRLPLWARWLCPYAVLLVLSVLTNDYHQLIFSFPPDAVVFTDAVYEYAPLYYVLLASAGVFVLLTFCIMAQRCRLPKNRRRMWLPVLPFLGIVVYTVLYMTGNPWVERVAPDMTISICCLTAAAFEFCIGNGLIQSNTHYRELLEHAGFPICIADRKGTVYMASRSGGELAEKIEQQNLPDSDEVLQNGDTRISAFPITKGTVYWEENIAAVQKEIAALKDLQESLQESHMISLEMYRTGREKSRLEEVNRLYDRMQLQTADCLHRIQLLLKEASLETGIQRERELLGRIAVYGAYFKRRNNLLFAAEEKEKMRGEELSYCLHESFAALEYLGIKAGYEVDEQDEFSLEDITRMYDLVHGVLESCLEYLSAVTVVVRRVQNRCCLYAGLSLKEPMSPGNVTFPDGFAVEEEDEGEYLLTALIGNEGKEASDGTIL